MKVDTMYKLSLKPSTNPSLHVPFHNNLLCVHVGPEAKSFVLSLTIGLLFPTDSLPMLPSGLQSVGPHATQSHTGHFDVTMTSLHILKPCEEGILEDVSCKSYDYTPPFGVERGLNLATRVPQGKVNGDSAPLTPP